MHFYLVIFPELWKENKINTFQTHEPVQCLHLYFVLPFPASLFQAEHCAFSAAYIRYRAGGAFCKWP